MHKHSGPMVAHGRPCCDGHQCMMMAMSTALTLLVTCKQCQCCGHCLQVTQGFCLRSVIVRQMPYPLYDGVTGLVQTHTHPGTLLREQPARDITRAVGNAVSQQTPYYWLIGVPRTFLMSSADSDVNVCCLCRGRSACMTPKLHHCRVAWGAKQSGRAETAAFGSPGLPAPGSPG